MWTARQQQVSRVLTACCAVLWLTGPLSVAQDNWTAAHCTQGQTQNSQHSHNHCAWHCGGIDIQGSGGRGEFSTDIHVSRIWSLGVILLLDTDLAGELPPRGPPQIVIQIA